MSNTSNPHVDTLPVQSISGEISMHTYYKNCPMIVTGSIAHQINPILAAILEASPKTDKLITFRGKSFKKTKTTVKGLKLDIGVDNNTVHLELAVAKDLTLEIYLSDDIDANGIHLSYRGRNGDLTEKMSDITMENGTVTDIFHAIEKSAVPALLAPFADFPILYSYQEIDRPHKEYITLELDGQAAEMSLSLTL